jgi:uncharacterized transporter YbjL
VPIQNASMGWVTSAPELAAAVDAMREVRPATEVVRELGDGIGGWR